MHYIARKQGAGPLSISSDESLQQGRNRSRELTFHPHKPILAVTGTAPSSFLRTLTGGCPQIPEGSVNATCETCIFLAMVFVRASIEFCRMPSALLLLFVKARCRWAAKQASTNAHMQHLASQPHSGRGEACADPELGALSAHAPRTAASVSHVASIVSIFDATLAMQSLHAGWHGQFDS